MSAVLEISGLTVDIPVAAGDLHAVRGIDFSVDKGETLCIVGESGCGKSLTSLSIMGLLPKRAKINADKMQFTGTDLLSLSERELAAIRGNRMAMIFQEPMTSLNPAYTIGNQLMEPYLRHKKSSDKEARDRAIYLLERVGITAAASRLSQYPHQLSGGLRQRVMIAMALMCDPELIIADEPTTALDVTIQAQILHLLAELRNEFNSALILITHDLGVVARVADKVAVMYAGKIVEAGTVEEIFNQPLHPYTQGLINCIPVPGKTARGSRLGSIPGIVPTLIGDIAGCSFRNRCGFAHDACDTKDPFHTLNPGRGYRCTLDVTACEANAKELVSA
ncbi:ABC transporter ATP-binding protein [Nisaea sp.]|uniref:ABC transporter ATP-binding protein n=1 Tax=Nisaea sp. TaxID=2024842 RepID=UPI00329A0FE3